MRTDDTLPGGHPAKTPDPALLDCKLVAALCGCSPRMVWRMRDTGDIPAPLRLGGLVRWRRADIERWISDGCPRVRSTVRAGR
jgi:prophage regulatory protein